MADQYNQNSGIAIRWKDPAEARVIVESWRVEFNEMGPHSSLGYLSPSEYMQKNQTTKQTAEL